MTYLGFAQAVKVWDIEGITHCSCVHTSSATLLQPQVIQDLAKASVLQAIVTIREVSTLDTPYFQKLSL